MGTEQRAKAFCSGFSVAKHTTKSPVIFLVLGKRTCCDRHEEKVL